VVTIEDKILMPNRRIMAQVGEDGAGGHFAPI
jgi:hypothetical protein